MNSPKFKVGDVVIKNMYQAPNRFSEPNCKLRITRLPSVFEGKYYCNFVDPRLFEHGSSAAGMVHEDGMALYMGEGYVEQEPEIILCENPSEELIKLAELNGDIVVKTNLKVGQVWVHERRSKGPNWYVRIDKVFYNKIYQEIDVEALVVEPSSGKFPHTDTLSLISTIKQFKKERFKLVTDPAIINMLKMLR